MRLCAVLCGEWAGLGDQRDGEWAGQQEQVALALLLGVTLRVYQPGQPSWLIQPDVAGFPPVRVPFSLPPTPPRGRHTSPSSGEEKCRRMLRIQ